MSWQQRFERTRATLPSAIELIRKGKHIFVGSGAAEPTALVDQLIAEHDRFADNTIVQLIPAGRANYIEERYQERFRYNACFIGEGVRDAVYEGRADYTPVLLSQLPDLIRSRRVPVDVALIAVTPPDAFGFVNLGVSVGVTLAAIEAARVVIAEINPRMPSVHGAGFVPMHRLDAWVECDAELPTASWGQRDEVSAEIGRHVASLVEDGSTLQVGPGRVSEAAAAALRDKHELGIWTEILSDGLVALIDNGNVTGSRKTMDPGRVSASFAFGSKRAYELIDRNPSVAFRPSDVINDPATIARQHKMVAIGGALHIDLTGQACSDSFGTGVHSGIGGQVDFIRGASMCRGGKPIIALRSTAREGAESKIVATLEAGSDVVTSRRDVHYVVTEYGVADLRGKSIRERVVALLSIAHPDFRSELLAAAKERRYVFPDQLEPRRSDAGRYERRICTRGGQEVLLRPLRETDETKLTDFFYNLSQETVYKRWLTGVPRIPRWALVYYLHVDDAKTVAIVAQSQSAEEEPELLGVGRYTTDAATGWAEVAFVVRDDWQGQGIGTALFSHLIDIARENGIPGFSAEVLATNNAMLRVFHNSGLPIESVLEGTDYALRIPLSPARGAARP